MSVVTAVAPIRICDNGGWTDTWFAGHGKVFNIAVYPYVEVQVASRPGDGRVTLFAENYGERYDLAPGGLLPDRHPLLEAAVVEAGVPRHLDVEISIHSEAPAGCSTGTSAAVVVALIGALDALTPGRLTPMQVARTAHRVEVERLGLECGIQDQLASAHGGINYIEMHAYPDATVTPIEVPDPLWWELERRLVLIFLGRTHNSSEVHERVIADLDNEKLEPFRQAAERSRDALLAGDLAALGQAMRDNTAAQADLHPALISPEAAAVIDIGRDHGALGWKVNGAGGEGGSITLLAGGSSAERRELVRAITAADSRFQAIPIYLSRRGLRVWTSED